MSDESTAAPPLPWLDRDKLRDLGFDVRREPEDPEAETFYACALRRRVHLLLEVRGGPEDAMRSRLAVVDASLDAEELRRRHPDARKSAIAPGLVRILASRPAGRAPFLTGRVFLEVPFVHVPRDLRRTLDPFLSQETAAEFFRRVRAAPAPPAPAPRYAVVLAFGRANACWLRSVSSMSP